MFVGFFDAATFNVNLAILKQPVILLATLPKHTLFLEELEGGFYIFKT
jgi:hypothetical protein